MEPIEIRDLEVARSYVVEGLWLQRVAKPAAATVRPALEWSLEIAAGGHPLPPVGYVADIGNLAFGAEGVHRPKDLPSIPGWPQALARSYEDDVLAKFYADWMFERAVDAMRHYQGRERVKGLAYCLNQIRDRSGTTGVLLPPAVIRGLLSLNPDEILALGWDRLLRDGPSELLLRFYSDLGGAFRRMNELLAQEDIDAIEDRSALGDMGQYVALRQIRQMTSRLESLLPARPVKPLVGRKEVPTRVHDEDQYPVGGYTSLSTRGSIESLLQSQLAYMEKESPDLFDMKYVREELFYYSRDENQFLRRRRSLVFVLFPDLIAARYKDPELPHQRIVMLQAMVLALVHKLTDWLSTDAIRFEVLFVQEGEKKALADEATLMQLLLREHIERRDTVVEWVADRAGVVQRLNRLARQSQVHCLAAAADAFELEVERAVVTEVVVNGARPEIGGGDGIVAELAGDDAFEVWLETVLRILQLWL